MKRLVLYLFLLLAFSCTKEKKSNPIIGKWTIIETASGTGYGFITQTYSPNTEVTIEFNANGDLLVTGSNPGKVGSSLWAFNKYEILPDDTIRFFHTSTTDQMTAYLVIDDHLSLWYNWARCGYGEKFIKSTSPVR